MVLLLNHPSGLCGNDREESRLPGGMLYPVKQEEVWRRVKGFRKLILHILQDVNNELNLIYSIFLPLFSPHSVLHTRARDSGSKSE